jgi:hypothetical protein
LFASFAVLCNLPDNGQSGLYKTNNIFGVMP